MSMRFNSGPEFVHPVTHEVVPSDVWYEGAAHQPHEDMPLEAIEDVTTEGAEPQETPAQRKKAAKAAADDQKDASQTTSADGAEVTPDGSAE